MTINRDTFFANVRKTFGKLTQNQVDGFNVILDVWSNVDLRFTAYALATAWHETAHTMQPIKERGGAAYFKRMYDPEGERPKVARDLGNTKPGDGAKFCGRGYVQLTGRANYFWVGARIGVNLIADPDLAMQPKIAAEIMLEGMTSGWFTTKKLADYFNDKRNDPKNARRIINRLDKAVDIAGYYAKFLSALVAAEFQEREKVNG